MENYKNLVLELVRRPYEEEWFEFKHNWFDVAKLGEYISAISNSAILLGKNNGYFIWGVTDKEHSIVGTDINYNSDFHGEPLQHYLARLLSPTINFDFNEVFIDSKRVVVLTIPAAYKVPTAFNRTRYIRIGSSKEKLERYPDKEAKLFSCLNQDDPTIENTPSEFQNLTFKKLFTYYAGRGIELNRSTFKKNLRLLTKDGKYNVLAQLLSDDCRMPIRVSIFQGKSKSDKLFSIKEFGYTCILLALDKVLEYSDVINIVQVDESNRRLTRKDVNLFDSVAFREALVNSFVHNKWIDGNGPMFSVFSDRIEILSRGTIAPTQTMDGFFLGESVPVNQSLSDIFLQLHISERSGRGVPKILDIYSKDVFEFRSNSIVVKIPFNVIQRSISERLSPTSHKKLTNNQKNIVSVIRDNPNVTQPQIAEMLSIGRTTVYKEINTLKTLGIIKRIGSRRSGYWEEV